jgi:hypothetical protein
MYRSAKHSIITHNHHLIYKNATAQLSLTWFDALNSSIDFVVSKDLMSRTITAGLIKFVSTLKMA